MRATESWMEQSQYDLTTARAMLESGRLLYVLFCCQQAVEKMLKAVITKKSNEFPPRIHQLIRLAEVAQLDMSESQDDFLRELSVYYIQTRYPEEISSLSAKVDEAQARRILDSTEKMIQWLHSML